MLNLICGEAFRIARAQVLCPPVADDILFVVPDEITARSVAGYLGRAGSLFVDEQRVIGCDALLEMLAGGDRNRVPDDVRMALIRQIIESDLRSFDYLVGSHSVPRLTYGVLRRIATALEVIQNDAGREVYSIRERQLMLLSQRIQERLTAGGFVFERYAQRETLANVKPAKWKSCFPLVKQVVFLDFSGFSDVTVYLIKSAAGFAGRCDVYMDFDPEADNPALDGAYQKLFDLADNLLVDRADMGMGQGELFDGEGGSGRVTKIVHCNNVRREITAVVGFVRDKLTRAKDEGRSSAIIIAPSNMSEYLVPLDRELANYGIDAVSYKSISPVDCAAWQVIEKLREISYGMVPASVFSGFWRTPGFNDFIQNRVTSVESWNLASRLDYVLTLTGGISGRSNIEPVIRQFLKRLHEDREKIKQLSADEVELDQKLLGLIQVTLELTEGFTKERSLGEWSAMVVSFIEGMDYEAGPGQMEIDARQEIVSSAGRLAELEDIFNQDVCSFPAYVSFLRTTLQGKRIDNADQLLTRDVTVCSPAVAARLRSDYCLVLGFNDGYFPKFASPDSSFLGTGMRSSQTMTTSVQRNVMQMLCRSHANLIFCVPERSGTEELLPSQFLEDLVAYQPSEIVTVDEFTRPMEEEMVASKRGLQYKMAKSLSGLALEKYELKRFGRFQKGIANAVHGISLVNARSGTALGSYDGIITDPVLKEWLAGWAERHIYSVSQLDTVVGCSFRFFADRMLNLEELEEADDLLPAHTFGSFTHDVLSRFYRAWVADGRGVPAFDDEITAREKLYAAYLIEHKNSLDLSDFARDLLNLKLFGDLTPAEFGEGSAALEELEDPGVLGQFLLMEMHRGSTPGLDYLQPSNFEVGFGMGRMDDDDPLTKPEYLELDLGEGEKIKLRGRIDRIDLSPTGVFAVTDYKTGRIPEKRQILGGFRTQLPIYVLVGEELLRGKYDHPEAAGGLYYPLKRGTNVKVSGVFFRSAFQEKAGVQGRCLKDEEFDATLNSVKHFMRHSLRAVRRGYLTTTWRDEETVCKFCSFEGLCYRNVERTSAFWESIHKADNDENG